MAAPISNTMSAPPAKKGLLPSPGSAGSNSFLTGYKPAPTSAPVAGGMSIASPAQLATPIGAAPKAAPAAPAGSAVSLTGVPASAVAALASSGLSGNELTMAQKALSDHYTSVNGAGAPTTNPPAQPLATAPIPNTPNTGTPATTPPATPQPLFPSVVSSLAQPQPSQMATDAAAGFTKQNDALQGYEASLGALEKGIYTPSVTTSGAAMQGRAATAANVGNQVVGNLQNAVIKQQGLVSLGQNQQSLNQSAQGTALGALATSQPQFQYDPTTGQYTMNVGGSGIQSPSQVAEQLNSGQLSPTAAASALSYLGPTAQSQLIAAMKQVNPGFNWNTAAGQAAGQQAVGAAAGNTQASNIQTLGTAQAQGQAGVQATIPAMQAANTAADGVKNTIEQYLAANPNINASNLAASNQLQQWLQGKQLTDPKYQTLFNYLNEYTNTLTPTLGVGGDSTNLKTQIAASFVNAAASGQSIAEVLDNMQSLAGNKVQNLQSGSTGGGIVAGPGSGSGGGGSAGTGGGWASLGD